MHRRKPRRRPSKPDYLPVKWRVPFWSAPRGDLRGWAREDISAWYEPVSRHRLSCISMYFHVSSRTRIRIFEAINAVETGLSIRWLRVRAPSPSLIPAFSIGKTRPPDSVLPPNRLSPNIPQLNFQLRKYCACRGV